MIELVTLGMLMQGRMSGYDIKKITEQTIGIFYKMSYGSLYPALKRLVDEAYLTEEETNDSKNKKLYAVTAKGQQHFIAWLREPLKANKREYMVKIFFYDYLDEETRQRNLSDYQRSIERQIGQLNAVQAVVAKELEQLEHKEQYYYRVSTMHYGLQFFQMEHEWLNQIMNKKEF
jgi:DNA-binding PadR family transcriptional regulator